MGNGKFRLANKLVRDGHYVRATALYQELLELSPGFGIYRFGLEFAKKKAEVTEKTDPRPGCKVDPSAPSQSKGYELKPKTPYPKIYMSTKEPELTGPEKRQRDRIELAKKRLYNLGFKDKPIDDLRDLFEDKNNRFQRKLAAWELALYYANQQSPEALAKALVYLDEFIAIEDDPRLIKEAILLKVECESGLKKNRSSRRLLQSRYDRDQHPDYLLGIANAANPHDPEQSIAMLNKVFQQMGVERVVLRPDPFKAPLDRLAATASAFSSVRDPSRQPLVSVIMPVFNSEDVLESSLRSILSQSWGNLEVFVVDDCSTDKTADVVRSLGETDKRVKYIKTSRNNGAYVARNLALEQARGVFVTTQDADDWAHPRKIEIQARHLQEHRFVIGNMSEQTRVLPNLRFHRRQNRAGFIFANMSSFMFRRVPVVERCGCWDCVRFGADSELIRRIRKLWGTDAVVEIPTGPLTLQRQSSGSLTGHSAFGFHGYFIGCRQEYKHAAEWFHEKSTALRFVSAGVVRPFAVPGPMLPHRATNVDEAEQFDVIIASEFRMRGGSVLSCVEEVKAQTALGLKTGLIQLSRYDQNPKDKVLPVVREVIDGEMVKMLVYGERVKCKILIIRYPPVLQILQEFIPEVNADRVVVVVNQPPMSDYGPNAVRRYSLESAERNLRAMFRSSAPWFPIGALVREALLINHKKELDHIQLAEENWSNILDASQWAVNAREVHWERPRIGRHARDKYVKWPATKTDLLDAYPDDLAFEVRILGGAQIPFKLLGEIPANWKVWGFDEIDPRSFLADLDVFVYFTHPDWVESFGRVIIEAMAAGVPVVLPKSYQREFGDAAVYCDVSEVKHVVNSLMGNRKIYFDQQQRGYRAVKHRYSYNAHYLRLGLSKESNALGNSYVQPKTMDSAMRALIPDFGHLSGTSLLTQKDRYAAGNDPKLNSLIESLVGDAENAITRGLHSVIDKTTLPPSGNPRDYWHPAPYWWPNPESADGFPYVRKDGERVPGTSMYEQGSNAFDRTRIQRVFDDSLILALAWWFTEKRQYLDHAANICRRFFIDPETSMNPHLEFSQVKRGHNKDHGSATGIIETKDFYYYLDVVRLLQHYRALTVKESKSFNRWLCNFGDWLCTSRQGIGESKSKNNHGTYYELQLISIFHFLGDPMQVRTRVSALERRIIEQIDRDGVQHEELKRTTSAHYCTFNLQGWENLNKISTKYGFSLYDKSTIAGSRLMAAVEWLASYRDSEWPFEQIDAFDQERIQCLITQCASIIGLGIPGDMKSKQLFHPHDGIRPYWVIGS